jgi:sulfur relay (sulfurtransferase) DsrF/TusC family protein
MLVIIESFPYASENPLGALFLAYSTGEAGELTHVYFVGDGVYCLVANQNENNAMNMPPISDIIMSLIGTVKFHYIPDSDLNPFISNMQTIKGVKKASYQDLANAIENFGKNLIIL